MKGRWCATSGVLGMRERMHEYRDLNEGEDSHAKLLARGKRDK